MLIAMISLTELCEKDKIRCNLRTEELSMVRNINLRNWWWQTFTVCPQEPERA